MLLEVYGTTSSVFLDARQILFYQAKTEIWSHRLKHSDLNANGKSNKPATLGLTRVRKKAVGLGLHRHKVQEPLFSSKYLKKR